MNKKIQSVQKIIKRRKLVFPNKQLKKDNYHQMLYNSKMRSNKTNLLIKNTHNNNNNNHNKI